MTDEQNIDSLHPLQAMALLNKITHFYNLMGEGKKEVAFFAMGCLTERLAKNVRTAQEAADIVQAEIDAAKNQAQVA